MTLATGIRNEAFGTLLLFPTPLREQGPGSPPYLAEHPVEALRLHHVLHGIPQTLQREAHAAHPGHAARTLRPMTAARPGTARLRFRPARRAMELEARAEPRSPRAGRGEEEEDEDEELRLAKRRKVLCSEFAAITSSDEAVASGFLAGSGWHLEVGPAAGGGGRGERPPFPCTLPLCFRGRWTPTLRRR